MEITLVRYKYIILFCHVRISKGRTDRESFTYWCEWWCNILRYKFLVICQTSGLGLAKILDHVQDELQITDLPKAEKNKNLKLVFNMIIQWNIFFTSNICLSSSKVKALGSVKQSKLLLIETTLWKPPTQPTICPAILIHS